MRHSCRYYARVSGPEIFGRYVLASPLGEGGVGYVFLAVTERGTPCVIKRLFKDALADPEARARFDREATLSVSLEHPNLVRTLDCGVHNQEPYLAQEFLDGRDLQWFLDGTEAGLSPDAIAFVAHQVLQGLDSLHSFRERGLVHRDVTPTNIRITKQGAVKLLDFGLAKDRVSSRLTRPGSVLGKLAYMAPEQIAGQTLDARADLYSLAVVMWELLTRRRLAEHVVAPEGGFKSHGDRLLKGVAPDPATFNAETPTALAKVVMQGLEKPPLARRPSAFEMARDLEPWVAQGRRELASLAAQQFQEPLQEAAREAALEQAREHIPQRGVPTGRVVVPQSRKSPTPFPWLAVGAGAFLLLGFLLLAQPWAPRQAEVVVEPPVVPAPVPAAPFIASPPPVPTLSAPAPAAAPEKPQPRLQKPIVAKPTPSPAPEPVESPPAVGTVTADAAMAAARKAFAAGNYAAAAEASAQAISQGADAHALLGAASFKLERYSDAERAFANALAKSPGNESLLRQLAAARQRARQATVTPDNP